MIAFFNSLDTSNGQEFLALKAGNVLCLYLVNSFPALLSPVFCALHWLHVIQRLSVITSQKMEFLHPFSRAFY